MIKCIILNGIPVVMEAFMALAQVEKPEDQDHSFTRCVVASTIVEKHLLNHSLGKVGRRMKRIMSVPRASWGLCIKTILPIF
jgi:hypothetical protein